MGLLDALRAGVKVADTVTKDLQPVVLYHRYLDQTGSGGRTYDPPLGQPGTPLRAVVDWKSTSYKDANGDLALCKAYVMFLNVNELAAATGNGRIQDEDVLILPDGSTGPIVNLGGFTDRGTGFPLATEVWIG